MDSYLEKTIKSRCNLIRWSHEARFAKALELAGISRDDSVFDFGSGNCFLAAHIKDICPEARVTAFEPYASDAARTRARQSGFELIERAEDLTGQFDRVLCLETLEHVHDNRMDRTLQMLASALKPDGLLVVSVPIEIGPVSGAKNLLRLVAGNVHDGATLGGCLRMLVGLSVPRYEQDGQYLGHTGFDYRPLIDRLSRTFQVERLHYTPLGVGGALLNSQVFLVLRRPVRSIPLPGRPAG